MYNIVVFAEYKELAPHIHKALKKYAMETWHVINVVDADALPNEAEWFKDTYEEDYTTIVVSEGGRCLETYDFYKYDRVFFNPQVTQPMLENYDMDLHDYYNKRVWCIGGNGKFYKQLTHICTDFAELPPHDPAATNGLSVLAKVLKTLIGKIVITPNIQ